jgi:hypothetical protein
VSDIMLSNGSSKCIRSPTLPEARGDNEVIRGSLSKLLNSKSLALVGVSNARFKRGTLTLEPPGVY